jgi:hypothetical protein
MRRRRASHHHKPWPLWTIIPIGLALAGFSIVLGLVLEPAGHALNPERLDPTATLPTIAYSYDLSESCHDCHFSLQALRSSAADPGTAESYLIEPESIDTPHGQLGCLACHGGDGAAQDKTAAHQGLIADLSAEEPEKCVICHTDLPDEIPGDRLRVPHGIVSDRIEAGIPCGVHCSDCHGGVGHGFDPLSGAKFCSMAVCLDCHQKKQVQVQTTDCNACHLGPHEQATALTCSDCHISADTWAQVALDVHPEPLPGQHGQAACFDCHDYPDFAGLSDDCADCHRPGHTDWVDQDCSACHEPGATWDTVASKWEGHAAWWDQYKGAHLQVACQDCHGTTYTDLNPSCDSCHTAPADHQDGRSQALCTTCHQADRPWRGQS